jgi:hypothetical protein
MLSSRKIRRSGRLAKIPRVDYSKYFFTSREDSSDESVQEGSVSTFATYNIQDTPKSVLKQINTVKKMRLESGSAAAVTEVRRSARIAAKLQQEVNDIANILLSMKITPQEVGANTNTLFTEDRPPFLEPITTTTNNTVVVDMEALNTQFAALLNNIATTKDLYGDIIKVAEMITAYPELVVEDDAKSSLRLVGRAISVRFLADEDALKSDRSNDISNAISLLLSL